jgi:hypothetical protein
MATPRTPERVGLLDADLGDLGDLDMMQWVAGIDADPAYEALAGASISGELDGIPLEHPIAMKRAAGRPRDLDDLQRLGAT